MLRSLRQLDEGGTSALELSDAARGEIAIPFIPLWITIGVLNGIAFFTSPKEKTA